MRKNPFKTADILWKYLRQELPEQESERFGAYIERIPSLKAIHKELQNKEDIEKELDKFALFDTEKALEKIHRRHRYINTRRFRIRYAGIAAAVAALLGTAVLFPTQPEKPTATANGEITAKTVRVVLKTAGGQIYGLDTLSKTVREGQKVAFDNHSGILNVAALSKEETMPDSPDNTVEVPCGGTYILCLQDSTKVYLNSGSRLEFPSRFANNERKVKITGEAFFEVVHHADWPFVIELPNGQIRVWGTSFNVKAYPEEEMIFTTLIEGKVSFRQDDRTDLFLQPGEQLSYHKSGGQTELRKVDTRLYTAWKDGLFWFHDMALEDILKIISRWFDIEILYLNPEIKTVHFSGKMKMYSSIEDILRKFEKSNEVAFQLKGRTLTVYRK
ncbi:MAG: DUF4974 domain-containing protein [Odoribacter sp.]|nr:DUF4974 domain-containing protein [Odoribacter sp.]